MAVEKKAAGNGARFPPRRRSFRKNQREHDLILPAAAPFPHAQANRNGLCYEPQPRSLRDAVAATYGRTVMILLGKCARAPVRCMLALAAVILMQTAVAFAAEQVDLLLVLSSDVSRSVDHPKFLLQREGYAAAISDPHVMDAIKSGPQQRIAVCFVEWSGFGAQKLVIDWTIIDGPDAARKFGDQLLELPRSFADRT